MSVYTGYNGRVYNEEFPFGPCWWVIWPICIVFQALLDRLPTLHMTDYCEGDGRWLVIWISRCQGCEFGRLYMINISVRLSLAAFAELIKLYQILYIT
jgi:hypothetical protein